MAKSADFHLTFPQELPTEANTYFTFKGIILERAVNFFEGMEREMIALSNHVNRGVSKGLNDLLQPLVLESKLGQRSKF